MKSSKLLYLLYLFSFQISCNQNQNKEDCIKSDSDQFIEILKSRDKDFYELLTGFESFLINSNYIKETDKEGFLILFSNLKTNKINIPVYNYYNSQADPMEEISPNNYKILYECIENIDSECNQHFKEKYMKLLSIIYKESVYESKTDLFLKELDKEYFNYKNSRFMILLFTWYLASDTYYS